MTSRRRLKLPHYTKILAGISLFLRLTLVLAAISAVHQQNWITLFVIVLAFVLMSMPSVIRKNIKIVLPTEFEFLIVLFIYFSIFLGEIHNYYLKFWWWDILLHGSSGIALGFLGFVMLYYLYDEDKIKAKPITISFMSFCFALAMGALWEIFEFTVDQTFGLNMQKNGLIDTMWDLIVDALGALLTAILGFFYLKGGKTRLFEHALKKFERS